MIYPFIGLVSGQDFKSYLCKYGYIYYYRSQGEPIFMCTVHVCNTGVRARMHHTYRIPVAIYCNNISLDCLYVFTYLLSYLLYRLLTVCIPCGVWDSVNILIAFKERPVLSTHPFPYLYPPPPPHTHTLGCAHTRYLLSLKA